MIECAPISSDVRIGCRAVPDPVCGGAMSNSVRVVRGMSQSLCIALLLLTCGTLSAQNLSAQNQEARIRNIVLVHGAWADGSGWKKTVSTPGSRKLIVKSLSRLAMSSAYALCLSRKRLQFEQDGREIFRNRRMNMHCTLYDRVWSLRVHDIQQNMNDFIAAGAKNHSTQNLFCLSIDTDLHETLCLAFLKGAAYSAHRIFRSECTAPRLPYFGVCHAASA